MKIILFQGGKPGVLHSVSVENPLEELEELLDGPVEFLPLNDRLTLASREDGEAKQLPLHYLLHRLGREVEPVAGDCAVVARCPVREKLRSADEKDLEAAECYIRRREC